MKKLISFIFLVLPLAYGPAAKAQDVVGLPVNQVKLPAPFPVVQQFFYDGNNNVQYVCSAPQFAATTSRTVAATTLTNIVVATNVGTVTTSTPHGLYVGALVQVLGSATTALNGTYVIKTVPSTTTYTIVTAGVGDATYTDAGLVVSTSNPRLTDAVWSLQIFVNAGPSNAVSAAYFANNTVGLNQNSPTPRNIICANRAQY
jgi:hypothetical protein